MAINPNDPETRAQFQALAEGVRAELAKPKDQQDLKFLGHAVTVMNRVKAELGASETDVNPEQPQSVASLGQQVAPEQPPAGPEDPAQRAWDIVSTQVQAMGQAAQQRGKEVGDFVTQLSRTPEQEAALREQRAMEASAQNLRTEQQAELQGRSPESLGVVRGIGKIAPDVIAGAIPGAIEARGIGAAAARVAGEAGIGGVSMGADQYGAGTSGQGGFIVGALGSGLLGSLAELPGLGRDLLLRDMVVARKSPAFARNTQIEGQAGIPMSIGEKTGDPVVRQAEQAVRGRSGDPREQFLLNREQRVKSWFNDTIDRLNPKRQTNTQIVDEATRAYTTHIDEIQKGNSERFRKNLAPGLSAVGARIDNEGRILGGQRFLNPGEVIGELYTQARVLQEAPMVTDKASKLKKVYAAITELEGYQRKGGMTLGQVQRFSHDLSEASAPSGVILKDVNEAINITDPKAVARALERDLENASAAGGPGGDAADALIYARQQYSLDKDQLKVYEGTSLNKMVGKFLGDSPEQFAGKLVALPSEQFSELMQIADKADPGMGNRLRSLVFDELAQKHLVPDTRAARLGADVPRLKYGEFINEFDNKMPLDKFENFIGQGVDHETAVRMRAGLQAIRGIAEGPLSEGAGSVSKSLSDRLSQYAINAASRDKGFIARLLTGEFTPGVIERLLFTEQGRQSLVVLGKHKSVARAEFAQAANYVVKALSDDDENKAKLAEAQRKAAAVPAAPPRGSID